MKLSKLPGSMIGTVTVAMALLAPTVVAAPQAEQIIKDNCVGCHTEEKADTPQWSRISHQRKSPEGWLMSIARMQVIRGLEISDADRHTLVKYLADKQGLAPEETEGFRYAMERRLNTQENMESTELTEMCSRCHSGARVALQRRPASEWEHLVHFHLGQWPTMEYHMMSRDRDWFGLALNSVVPMLAKRFPLQSDTWKQWQQADKPELTGQWRLAGQQPGKGDFEGVMKVTGSDSDGYKLQIDGRYADGSKLKGSGSAVVYTGFEWRANLELGGVKMRQVLAASKDGSSLKGRMFEQLHDEIGMELNALKDSGAANQIVAIQPNHIKAGTTQTLTLIGNNLNGDVDLGAGLKVVKRLSGDDQRIQLQVSADKTAAVGPRPIKVGSSQSAELTVYNRIGRVDVLPSYGIARVGDGGGSRPKSLIAFQAKAWAPGADGKPGTDDDFEIGAVPANWHVEPFDEGAKADNDVKFSGSMDAKTGLFTPGEAGLNAERRMSTNNVGNLKVVAEVTEADQMISGDGHMIVTIQRWNNAPLP